MKQNSAQAASLNSDLNSNTFVISKNADLLFIGGASILLLILMHIMLADITPDSKISWWVYSLSFIANFPHFLVSYQILYYDHKNQLLKKPSFIWAAFGAPLIIISVLAFGYFSKQVQVWGYVVNAMYFFVGWHYVKQIFGGITVTNTLKSYFFNSIEKNILKINLFSLWAISFLGFNTGHQNYIQDGIPYSSLNLPIWTLDVAYFSLSLSAVVLFIVVVNKFIREGLYPAPAAVICFLTIYAWYLPRFSHPMFMHMIPFFHSMQYLFFVYAFRRNKTNASIQNLNSPEGRIQWINGIWGYFILACMTGGFFMYVFPRYLDSNSFLSLFGPTSAYFAFTVFINIHHYFIDNVIWRGQNEQMRKYLFSCR